MSSSDGITERIAAAYGLLGQYAAMTQAPLPPPAAYVQPAAVLSDGGNAKAEPLTISYGGKVVALDGCTLEKASNVMRFAAAVAGPPPKPKLTTPWPRDIRTSRQESLRRFLSKRKDRVSATTVPHVFLDNGSVLLQRNKKDEEDPEPKKAKLEEVSREEAKSWLALGSLTEAFERRRL